MTVHFRGKCINAQLLTCFPGAQSQINKRQPFCVMAGWAHEVRTRKMDNGQISALII